MNCAYHDHVTLDIDVPFGTWRLPSVKLAKWRWAIINVLMRRSAGGNTHYRLCVRTIGAEARFRMRADFSDDPTRLAMDRARYQDSRNARWSVGVLHDSRNTEEAGEWVNGYPE